MSSYLIVDVDDLKTRVALIEEKDGRFILKGIDEAATTVEPPILDVNIGIKEAVENLEISAGVKLSFLEEEVDRFLCTSSSGGGLYMIVAGLTSMISAESGKRAVLGAGAHLIDVFSFDDGRQKFQRVEKMRIIRPDIILLTGGTNGGAVNPIVEMAESIRRADIKPRFGDEFKLPVIYAGNIESRGEILEVFDNESYALKMVNNVRPIIERENLSPARDEIYNSYMEHIISHSPGYGKLSKRVDDRIIPSQAAICEILDTYALKRGLNLLGVNVGSSTTDLYSVYNGVFNRSLNAGLGLSYGLGNIMKEAGIERLLRWLPKEIEEDDLRDLLWNMMLKQGGRDSPQENLIHHAAAREAIRLGLVGHESIATRLKGVKILKTISDIFNLNLADTHISDISAFRIVIGRGRIFSTTSYEQAANILIDAIQPEGVTEIYLDEYGLLPHLGILSKVNREAAYQVLENDGLTHLCTCISPRGVSDLGEVVVKIVLEETDGSQMVTTPKFGELVTIPLKVERYAEIEIQPTKRFDLGKGLGKIFKARVTGSLVGLVIDARGRPMTMYPRDSGINTWHDNPFTSVSGPAKSVGGN